MSRKKLVKLFLIIAFVMLLTTGCSRIIGNTDKMAYISSNTESDYKKTFEDLNLGVVFDFDLMLPAADKSWTEIWVEGYRDGELIEPGRLADLSFGISPNQVEKGNMGLGILNPNSDVMQFLLYSPGAVMKSEIREDNIFTGSGGSTWDYAIGNSTVELDSGEEKVLAVYRQVENQLRTYDYQDSESLNKMIKEDQIVLLLKIKVTEKTGL